MADVLLELTFLIIVCDKVGEYAFLKCENPKYVLNESQSWRRHQREATEKDLLLFSIHHIEHIMERKCA